MDAKPVKFSKYISNIFHPITMPLYASLVILFGDTAFAGYLTLMSRLQLVFFVVISTIILPVSVLSLLRMLKVVDGYQFDTQRNRVIPLLVVAISYMIAMLCIHGNIGKMAYTTLLSSAVLVTLTLVITIFWKISVHLVGLGGIAAIFFVTTINSWGNLEWFMILSILIAGIVGSARIYLNQHTLTQVVVGGVFGFVGMLTLVIINM